MTATARRGFSLPLAAPVPQPLRSHAVVRRHVERTGAALLNQQCWLWGCDVRREGGNLLLQHGFDRMRPPNGMDRSTQYTLDRSGAVIRLWGSGVYAGNRREGLFVNRFLFQPRCARHDPGTWQDPAALKRGPHFWDRAQLTALCTWIAGYEAAILRECGVSYRRLCLGSFPESVSHAEGIPAAWQHLATLLDTPQPHTATVAACVGQTAFALKPVTSIAGC